MGKADATMWLVMEPCSKSILFMGVTYSFIL